MIIPLTARSYSTLRCPTLTLCPDFSTVFLTIGHRVPGSSGPRHLSRVPGCLRSKAGTLQSHTSTPSIFLPTVDTLMDVAAPLSRASDSFFRRLQPEGEAREGKGGSREGMEERRKMRTDLGSNLGACLLFHLDSQLLQHHLWETLFFPHWIILVPLWRIGCLHVMMVHSWALYSVSSTYLFVSPNTTLS